MRFSNFAAAVVVTCFLIAQAAHAQATRPEGAGAGPDRSPATLVDRVRQAMQEIQLSDEQKVKIDGILNEARAELETELPKLRDVSQAERLEKLRGFMTNLRDRILPELTDEQRPRFEQAIRQLREGNPGGPGGGGRGRPGFMLLDELAEKLDLSPEQKTKFDALRAEAREKMNRAREDLGGDMQATREKSQAIFRETREKFDEILSPEQRQKMSELLQQSRQGGGGGTGGDRACARPRATEDPQPATKPSDEPDKSKPSGGGAMAPSPPPGPGQAAPALALVKLDGSPVQLSSFKGKLLLLAFGSYSSPSFRQRAQTLEELRREYGVRVNFVVVYTKEAHPTGGWEVERNRDAEIAVPQHADESARRNAAKRAREVLKLQSTMTIDSMDDATATAYRAWPNNAAVLIGKDGTIMAYQEWFDAYGMREAIQSALAPAPSTRATNRS